MRTKNIILNICLSLLLFLINANSLFAQKITQLGKKESRSIFQLFKNNHYGVLPSLGKMKAAADNGIVQSVSQSFYDGIWEDNFRVNYKYSTDRTLITMIFEFFMDEETGWVEGGSMALKVNSAGYPENISIDIFSNTSEQHYYYASTNPVKLDSVTNKSIDNSLETYEVDVFNYVTQDSIRLINTTIENGVKKTSYNNYLVNRDGNFIEFYDEGDYMERYINVGITFEEFLENLLNDFFFIEIHNHKLYSDDTEFTPYSRTTLSKNGQVVTGTLEELYNVERQTWLPDIRHTFTYENGKLVMDEEAYSYTGTSWISEDRTLYSYKGSVSNEMENEVVKSFKLSQNYPNPFNPSTKIAYSIPKAEHVTLQVFNVIGNRIATLVEAPQQAGSHTVTFDAHNYPSGIYYYKLMAGNSVEVRSMTLIK